MSEGERPGGGPRPVAGDDGAAIVASLDRPEAFAEIFDSHYESVRSYVSRRVGVQAGEEIVAETFARAFSARARYGASRPDARPWLLGIATNLLRRHWRSERRSLEVGAAREEAAAPWVVPEPPPMSWPRGWRPCPPDSATSCCCTPSPS